jgi:hypothetical protein
MRQTLDKIYTYSGCGTFFDPLTKPRDLVNHAIMEFITAECRTPGDKTPAHVNPEGFTIGTASGYDPVKIVEAIDTIHSTLKNVMNLISVARILFAGGNADHIWKDRHFATTRDAIYGGLGIRTGKSNLNTSTVRATNALMATTTPNQRKMLADVVLAIWCEFGIVNWRDDLYSTREIKSLMISYHDLPYVVATSLVREIDLPKAAKPVGSRVMFGKVFSYMEDAAKEIATRLNAIGTVVHFAGRITDAVALTLRGSDPALPKAPYAALSSAVNFLVPGAADRPFTTYEAHSIAPLVAETMAALQKAPHVVVRTTREFAEMFNIKRITAERTNASVLTLVTRRYSDTRLPARMFDYLDMSELGLAGIDPAESAASVPMLDATVDALAAMLSEGVVDEAFSSYSEADAQRVLVSTLPKEELVALAACLASEVDYSTSEANPDAPLDLRFVFRFDPKLTGWEDFVVTSIDGIAVTDSWEAVLKLATPYQGNGHYNVSDGLNELLGSGRPATIVGTVKPAWLAGGREYAISVSYPKFEYDPLKGMTVTGIVQSPSGVAMNALTLLGLAPMKSHSLAISPAARARLHDAALMFALAADLAHPSLPLPTYVNIYGVEGNLNPLFRADDVGTARREAVYSQLTILYTDAIIRFLTSQPARLAYSQAVLRAGGRAQKPTTHFEAKAYLDTVESYMQRFIIPLLGLPEQFILMFNHLRSAPMFQRLAEYEILHPERRF